LSTAPVAAFGFLGSNPGAITVQGSQLAVSDNTGISLIGGDITVQAGTLTAQSGQIGLVSVGRSSSVGGEVVIAGSGAGLGYTPTGFQTLGTINLTQGSTIDASLVKVDGIGADAGSVAIRGGQLLIDHSSVKAVNNYVSESANRGTIEVTANKVMLANDSTLDTTTITDLGFIDGALPGQIIVNAGIFSATDSAILAPGGFATAGGSVTIQGLQGSESYARSVSLTNTVVNAVSHTCECGPGHDGGPIRLQADKIALNQSTLEASGGQLSGGVITLMSTGGLDIWNSSILTRSDFASGGTVDMQAERGIHLTNTIIDASAPFSGRGGSVTLAAPVIALRGSRLTVGGPGFGFIDGLITLTGTKSVSLNDTMVSANDSNFFDRGGTILINGRGLFTSQHSTISARGGTIQVEAARVTLTDTLLTTSTAGGPQTVGSSITVDAKNTTLTNSQILSTATEGNGGTINIASPKFNQDASSVIDASSQFGTNGTVTINGVIQP
jgi:hypothetical protein